MEILRRAVLLLTASATICACGSNRTWLNSDRIERTFGSYGVDIIDDYSGRRVSSLYSESDGQKVTRTYAVVDFIGEPASAFADEHARIESGDSIGSTFRRAGWEIRKQHLFIGELEIPDPYRELGELMHIELPATLATHQYLFIVHKDERSWNYATITEIHHPDYLTLDEISTLYGEIIFDDSNRDSIHEFIGPPAMK